MQPNKELKLTKPSIMELRSFTLCSTDRLRFDEAGPTPGLVSV
jgi:hypothetical protein